MIGDKQLEILHDHYKETFARQLASEGKRDKLFIWVIALFAFLCLEIGYPASIGRSLGKIDIGGAELDLKALPLAALLDATWVLTAALTLRYCQTALLVARQYNYIHMLEENISPLLRGKQREGGEMLIAHVLHEDIYQREGKVYLRGYPVLLNVAWITYAYAFPLILAFATIGLLSWEWRKLPYSKLNRSFDTFVACAMIVFLLLYWVIPSTIEWWRMRKARRAEDKTKRLAATGATGPPDPPTQNV